MGSIDCDPASAEIANRTVKATVYFTKEQDGLKQKWNGNVWMNPPYAQPLMSQFAAAVAAKFAGGEIKQACVLVNNATETESFIVMVAPPGVLPQHHLDQRRSSQRCHEHRKWRFRVLPQPACDHRQYQ